MRNFAFEGCLMLAFTGAWGCGSEVPIGHGQNNGTGTGGSATGGSATGGSTSGGSGGSNGGSGGSPGSGSSAGSGSAAGAGGTNAGGGTGGTAPATACLGSAGLEANAAWPTAGGCSSRQG